MSSTVVRAGATLRSSSNTRCIAGDLPTRRSRRKRPSSSSRSARLSRSSARFSSARSTTSADLVDLERLGQVVVGAALHRGDRGLGRGEGGHHDDLGVAGAAALHSSSTSRPLPSGICRSVMTTSKSRARQRARAPRRRYSASVTSWPARVRRCAGTRASSARRRRPGWRRAAAAALMVGGLRSRCASSPPRSGSRPGGAAAAGRRPPVSAQRNSWPSGRERRTPARSASPRARRAGRPARRRRQVARAFASVS